MYIYSCLAHAQELSYTAVLPVATKKGTLHQKIDPLLCHIVLWCTWAVYMPVILYGTFAVIVCGLSRPPKTKKTTKHELFDCLQHVAAVMQECFPGGDCCCAACMPIAGTSQLPSMHNMHMLWHILYACCLWQSCTSRVDATAC